MNHHRWSVACIALALGCAAAAQNASQTQPALSEVQKQLRTDAEAVRPLVKSELGTSFLDGVRNLPAINPPTVYRDQVKQVFVSAWEIEDLDEATKARLIPKETTEDLYYYTVYGTPIAYARAIDLVGQAGLSDFPSKKVLDFGYGGIGQLRMMASRGAEVVGLDVETFLTALYDRPHDTGVIKGDDGRTGSIKLVNGRFSQDEVKEAVGDGYDLIISKNTLKNGYVHPPADLEWDKRLLVDLGVDDETFLRTLHDILKPGGYVMIYNLSPKQANLEAGESFIPMADGKCPFPRDLLEKSGFKVIEYDRNDDEAGRAMARALKWDRSERPMDVQNDLFAQYTLLRKPE
jgi:SAM-dependent methyltransferase